jgi:hypothetical protein
MTAEHLTRLVIEASRLSSWLSRDIAGWAPAGTDMNRLRRIYDKADRRLERRKTKLATRLRSVGAILERYNV